MSFNKTAIEWCDVTWNPWTGCHHGCEFCYAERIAMRFRGTPAFPRGFEPTYHKERLSDPVRNKKPKVVFVCSMGDLFGNWMKFDYIEEVVQRCLDAPQHTYMFLTKNPANMGMYFHHNIKKPQKNIWLGASVGENLQSWDRKRDIQVLGHLGWNTFLSVEPLWYMAENQPVFTDIDWLICGMRTNPLQPCTPACIEKFHARAFFEDKPVFYKDSVLECYPCVNKNHKLNKFPPGFPKLVPKNG